MARMRRDSSDSYGSATVRKATAQDPEPLRTTRTSPRKNVRAATACDDSLRTGPRGSTTLLPRDATATGRRSKLVHLTPLKSLRDMSDLSSRLLATTLLDESDPDQRTPAKRRPATASSTAAYPPQNGDDVACETLTKEDHEESFWCGSDASADTSEDELPSPRKSINFPPRRLSRDASQPLSATDLTRSLELLSLTGRPSGKLMDELPEKVISDSSRPTSSSEKENESRAMLHFTPPRLHSPLSPTKGRLLSPSKKAARVPTPPFRPSLDAFWNAETVNDWNDQYSPRKEWSPKKVREARDDASASPSASPRKPKSPTKRTKAESAVKKDWEIRKHEVAQAFLAELDCKVTDGKVAALAASTGGVQFVWSKTLNTTAGRANWRRETTRTRHSDGSTTATHKHHASIELAEKVIDDEERLLNVVAHEFCHLANFMISGIKDQPHGKQFQAWSRQCTRAFGHRGVQVTTKHAYQIEYRYIWRCSNDDCAAECKRHSKSIDPKRQTCGSCRGTLLQIKPVPRKDAAGGGGAPTGYAAYVKTHFASVRAGLPSGASQKEVMEAVGRQYRAEKVSGSALQGQSPTEAAGRAAAMPSHTQHGSTVSADGKRMVHTSTPDVEDMARELEVITIEDD
ncbi:hypothetical protein LTR53_009831 [Teratosphaeriaceae sp. CCFEE 6253]|nr:hypothetical protein LTR53_009831 [Teratosphaeriaceae sp. CCFEE 6253]